MAATPAFAQTEVEKALAARFAQVHALLAGPGPENRISPDELQTFLAREVVRRTLLSPAVVTKEWVAAQVTNLMNQSDTDRDGGVDAAELPELEGAKLRLLPNLQAAAQAERDSAPTVDFKTLLPKAAAVPPAPTPVGERLATWLQIRQAFLDEKLVEKPATLSFSTADLSDETVDAGARRNQWSIAAAVILKPSKWVKTTTRWELYPILAYEAALPPRGSRRRRESRAPGRGPCRTPARRAAIRRGPARRSRPPRRCRRRSARPRRARPRPRAAGA
jgi:hypothetical protein